MDQTITTREPTPEQQAQAPRKHMSKGEALFDAIVYGPVNFVGTFIASVGVAHTLLYGRLSGYFEAATKTLVDEWRFPKKLTKRALLTTVLMMGGNLMLLPIWGAEKAKKPIVDKLNDIAGERNAESKDITEPKQDIWSLAKSRGIAWLTVFGSLTALTGIAGEKRVGEFEKWVAETGCKIFGFSEDGNRKVINAKTHHIEVKAGKSRAYRYGEIAAIDLFATAAATILLYVGSRFFAKKREEKIARRDPNHARGNYADAANDNEFAANDEVASRADVPETRIAGRGEALGMVAAAPLQRGAPA